MSWRDEFRHSYRKNDLFYPELIPPHLEHKLENNPALARQFTFDPKENSPQGFDDPIGDEIKSQHHGIIHRYQNRILFTPTTACPVNCRYCFRKNELFVQPDFLKPNLSALEKYLIEHPEIEEVILSGGDPLMLSDDKLAAILKVLIQRKIKYLRIHTRMPVAIPTRMTSEFCEMLELFAAQFKGFFFVLHTNHASELDENVMLALDALNKNKINLISQSVLLKGVNDNPHTLKALFERLWEMHVKPYYLHHPDQVKGAMHFYLSEAEGLAIFSELKTICSGWLLPHYVVDHVSGAGKRYVMNKNI